ncbi:aspartate/tyrosine/aromatic aminotransferase [Mesorhizobium sp. RP14(2022)]|uniref:Aminotransferase n=1 Tax=Mesorhizobium liriopis TaxID=2953882 RepID=A0ABT1C831_9HYPH|nr:amino acid aminotransferase [Mesorhizobium liriopis]MCO6051003.1 aspartate/tyrosine/aromatic aminotransferase [Mesorhizobium liriopis]
MFETLEAAKPDKILALIGMLREDARENKVDLGVGVYKDDTGQTPVMRALRQAEERLLMEQNSKSYLGLAGDTGFNHAMTTLAFGEGFDVSRIRTVQAPGGSGALRILAELLKRAKPDATIWISDPTWPNHVPMMQAARLTIKTYPYFDAETGTVSFEAMVAALETAAPGDIVLLHGCCHNPTGANLNGAQWERIAQLLATRNLFPFIDIAYQGFGDGLEEDAAGLRTVAAHVPEMVVAASCSKNFAVYRDRVGAAMLMARNEKEATIAAGQLMGVARGSYSMPPDHGAAAVRIVLEDAALTADWKSELESMRTRMLDLRVGLADALRLKSNSDHFDFVARHRGMFSRLGLTPEQVARLRTEHAIYMVDDSRINVAGLPGDRLDEVAAAIVSVL